MIADGTYHRLLHVDWIKAMHPDAVNVTLGLPFVRTSPDHGTAFDIAGKGVADPKPMIAAIRLAVEMCRAKRTLI